MLLKKTAVAVLSLAAAVPAFAHDGWREHRPDRPTVRHYYPVAPVVVAPRHYYYAPPAVIYRPVPAVPYVAPRPVPTLTFRFDFPL